MEKGKELNDFQRNLLDRENLSNLRFGSLEIRDTSITRVTNSSLPWVHRLSVYFNLSFKFIGFCPDHSFNVTLSFPWPSHCFIRLKINTQLHNFIKMWIKSLKNNNWFHKCDGAYHRNYVIVGVCWYFRGVLMCWLTLTYWPFPLTKFSSPHKSLILTAPPHKPTKTLCAFNAFYFAFVCVYLHLNKKRRNPREEYAKTMMNTKADKNRAHSSCAD